MDLRYATMAAEFDIKIRFAGLYIATVIMFDFPRCNSPFVVLIYYRFDYIMTASIRNFHT